MRISSILHRRLLALAAASPDAEICGLLTGDEAIEGMVEAENVATDSSRAFEIDPATLFAAIRAERGGGQRLIGYYHSHPGGAATPSRHDLAQATDDGRLWLIIGSGELRAWRKLDDGFEEVRLLIGG